MHDATPSPALALASRLDRLGTETAFAVSAAAHAWQQQGHRVYPLHLGDLNIPTPASIVRAMQQAVSSGHTGYCPGPGILPLRAALARDVGAKRGVTYAAEDVSIQPGGKPVIGKFLSAVMNAGDDVLCPRPGYPIYESQVNYLGGRVVPYAYREQHGAFRLDLESLEAAVTPRTRVLIVNDCHNPTGARCSHAELERVAAIARRHDLWVLSDEAYFEMCYEPGAVSLASLPGMRERTVILYTCSKRFAMTGWRLGAAIGPRPVIEAINRLNANAESCTTHFVQHAMVEALYAEVAGPASILATLRRRRDRLVAALNEIPGVAVAAPPATFYLFVDMRAVLDRLRLPHAGELMERALRETGVSFCTRRHFGDIAPGERETHVRFAYAGIDEDDLLAAIRALRGLTA